MSDWQVADSNLFLTLYSIDKHGYQSIKRPINCKYKMRFDIHAYQGLLFSLFMPVDVHDGPGKVVQSVIKLLNLSFRKRQKICNVA